MSEMKPVKLYRTVKPVSCSVHSDYDPEVIEITGESDTLKAISTDKKLTDLTYVKVVKRSI